MALIQKYRNFYDKLPRKGKTVLLYKVLPEPETGEKRTFLVKDSLYTFKKKDPSGALMLEDHKKNLYIIYPDEIESYQYVKEDELNKLQKWTGKYYQWLLVFIFLLWNLILWLL